MRGRTYVHEGERWDYPDIKRVRRFPDRRPILLPRKDADLWKLGRGLRFTLNNGTEVCVQAWCRSQVVHEYWVVVYEGNAFPGELRKITIRESGPMMSGERYRPDGKRAHADGSECSAYYPCEKCYEEPG